MRPAYFVRSPASPAPALQVLGTEVRVLASHEDTGSYGITLQRGAEGTGPPPHCHDWDEAFLVLEGAVSFFCAGDTHHCEAGTLVHVAAGTVHGFTYCAGGGQMLEMTGEGTRAAQMFAAVDREVPPGAPDIPRVLGVLARHGVTVPQP